MKYRNINMGSRYIYIYILNFYMLYRKLKKPRSTLRWRKLQKIRNKIWSKLMELIRLLNKLKCKSYVNHCYFYFY